MSTDATQERLSAADVAKFTATVALAGIFVDAAIGHGLTWENDPYWTYWVTKTFLIATIFGLGTAWFGIGPGRGAVITVVHTLVLTVYYWTFSPIGLVGADLARSRAHVDHRIADSFRRYLRRVPPHALGGATSS
jgi:hypothetical protein